MSSNILLHPAVEPILDQALQCVTSGGIGRYPCLDGAVEKIGIHFGIPAEEVILVPGSDSALRLICRDFARSRQSPELLLQHPNYYAWEQEAASVGMTVERVPWNDIADPARELIDAARRSSDALIALSVPNGPIGGCIGPSRLDQLQDVARRRNHVVVIDSCYQAFQGDVGEQLRRRDDNVLIVQSLSKSHGLAGARLGLLCGKPSRINTLSQHRLEHAVSFPTIELALAVLDRSADFESIWAEIRSSRAEAMQALASAGYRPLPSGGNFISFRIGTRAHAAASVQRLSRRGYRVKNLSEIAGFEGYLRITIADRETTRTVLGDVLTVVEETFESERAGH